MQDHRDDERADRERLTALRRLAFGRVNTPGEETRASDALAELRAIGDLQEPLVDEPSAPPVAASAVVPENRLPSAPDPAPHRPSLRKLRPALIIVGIGAAALALAGGGFAANILARPDAVVTASPSPTPLSRFAVDPLADPSGQTRPSVAAEAWFSPSATAEDSFPYPVDDVEAHSTRLVQTERSGWKLWVARSTTGGLCLLTYRVTFDQSEPAVVTSCRSNTQFDTQGLTISLGAATASWTGDSIAVTLTPVGTARELP